MYNPVILIALALAAAFVIGFSGKRSAGFGFGAAGFALGAMTLFSSYWAYLIVTGSAVSFTAGTAGFQAPFSIALSVGKEEGFALVLINSLSFLGLFFLRDMIMKRGPYSAVVILLYVLGLNGIIITRDIFNYFVFAEIAAVAVAGFLLFSPSKEKLAAGFSWMAAAGLISIILILGAILTYISTGYLSIDSIAGNTGSLLAPASLAAFLLFTAVVMELKPFPANGWAIDVYEHAPAGVSALLSGAGVTAALFMVYKLMPVLGTFWGMPLAVIGGLSFVFSNLLALKTTSVRRMLGLSSAGQAGLSAMVIGLGDILGNDSFFILGSLVVTHAVAKAGLFWLNSLTGHDSIEEAGSFAKKPWALFVLGVFVFSLLALPPFPSFFAKWDFIVKIAQSGAWGWLVPVLLGSLLEAVYLFRWFGYAVKKESADSSGLPFAKGWKLFLPAGALIMLSMVIPYYNGFEPVLAQIAVPFLFGASFFVLDFLPAKLKNIILMAGMGYYLYYLFPSLTEFRVIFGIVFLGGGLVLLLAGFNAKGKRVGFYPSAALMYAGLAGLLTASTTLEFFFWWELMTLGSYFLILRGKKSMPHALSYAVFSLGGAYSMLAGFGLLAAANGGSTLLSTLATAGPHQAVIFLLLILGFLTKTATVPLHIWLPGAHSEAETDVSPVVSAVLLKAGVFGLIIVMLAMGAQELGGVDIYYVLGWVGVLTALIANFAAAFQEDAKKLLAYSSVGQLGYVVFALAMMSHLGWLTATTFALNHFIFKALLFLAVGGVVMRVGTRNMYEMGGLIKRMPLSFISVLIGIIALSGVPPLTGFAGKWLSYNAVVLKGWYFQGVVLSFAGLVAFLYCFRLIFAIFLGQQKDNQRHVKEAPFWIILPQMLLVGVLIMFGFVPNLMLKPVGKFITNYFPEHALKWEGSLAISPLGHWDGVAVMIVTGVVFMVVLGWLLFVNRKAVKIKQFNIVYAGERPSRPELTHFAYDFFAPYKRALGRIVQPFFIRFWHHVTESAGSVGDFLRRLFSGNSQSYAIHIVLFIVISFFCTVGG